MVSEDYGKIQSARELSLTQEKCRSKVSAVGARWNFAN